MKLLQPLIILALLLFSMMSINAQNKIRLYIESGQSNAKGTGNGALLSEKYLSRNKEILLYDGKGFKEMQPYNRKAEKFKIESKAFGVEVPFAYEMKKRYPEDIIVVAKLAIMGGTSIVAWDKNTERADWITDLKEVDNENRASAKLYEKLITDTKKCIQSLEKKYPNKEIELGGVLWLQTERDGKKIETVNKYEARLEQLIANVRNDLSSAQLPWFVMDAHIETKKTLKAQQAMLKAVSENVPNVRIVDASSLSTYEGVHFDTEGVTALGVRFAEATYGYDQAPKPPLGWNSFDSYGVYLYEEAAMANLEAFAEKLQPHGYEYFVIDAGWFGEFELREGTTYPLEKHAKKMKFNEFGLLQPSNTYFPNGLKPIIDRCHELGIKFGLHLMRGIPREVYELDLPIKGTNYTARDITDTTSICKWNPQNYGVDMTKPGAQEFYNSLMDQMAEWGVDFIKYDDLVPFPAEVEGIANAIAQCGRPMVLSLSPGGYVPENALTFFKKGNMLRVTHDIWDDEKGINQCFTAWKKWQGKSEPGFWVDMDMIPFGQLQLQNPIPEGLTGKESKGTIQAKIASGELSNVELLAGKGFERNSQFTKDQKFTFMTMRALSASPLMMGGDLPTLTKEDLEFVIHPEVLACNQNAVMGHLVSESENKIEIWNTPKRQSKNGWVGVFNRSTEDQEVSISPVDLGLEANVEYKLEDIWKDKKIKKGTIKVNAGGVIFIKYTQDKKAI